MSLIILRECNIGITSGDTDLWLDTVSELSLNVLKNKFYSNEFKKELAKLKKEKSFIYTLQEIWKKKKIKENFYKKKVL